MSKIFFSQFHAIVLACMEVSERQAGIQIEEKKRQNYKKALPAPNEMLVGHNVCGCRFAGLVHVGGIFYSWSWWLVALDSPHTFQRIPSQKFHSCSIISILPHLKLYSPYQSDKILHQWKQRFSLRKFCHYNF